MEFSSFVFDFSSRYIDRPVENEQDEDSYLPNYYHLSRSYHPNSLERYLRNLIALSNHDDDKYDESVPFERRTKAITKGDPREFMG